MPMTAQRLLVGARVFLVSALALTLATFVEAKDQLIDWEYAMARGNTQFDILQCQSVTFNWSADDRMLHDVWEFNSEAAYEACDFTQATKLADASATGNHMISGSKTLAVTKRWFGCKVGAHCSAGKMKVAVKTRPLLADKFLESECVGGTPLIARNEDDVVACRKRCKRRRDCNGLEYNKDAKRNCKLFSVAPERRAGKSNPNAQCEIAVTTCSAAGSTVPALAPAPAPEAGDAECKASLDLECIVCISANGCGGTDCNFYKDAKPCTRPIRYKYTFSNANDNFITVKKVGRRRTGESELVFAGQNYIMPKGNVQTYGEDLDFNFCNDGVKDTVFEAVIICNGVEKKITADYKLIY